MHRISPFKDGFGQSAQMGKTDSNAEKRMVGTGVDNENVNLMNGSLDLEFQKENRGGISQMQLHSDLSQNLSQNIEHEGQTGRTTISYSKSSEFEIEQQLQNADSPIR